MGWLSVSAKCWQWQDRGTLCSVEILHRIVLSWKCSIFEMFYISNVHENVLYLIGVWKTDGKTWWKNLTALLAEVCQPGPAQITLDEEDSRACEGGRSREREWEREKWDSDKSHIPAHNFIPKPLSVFPGTIRHKGSIKTLAWDFQSLLACL